MARDDSSVGPKGKGSFINIDALFDVHGGRYGPDALLLFGFDEARDEAGLVRSALAEMGADEDMLPVFDVDALESSGEEVLHEALGELVARLLSSRPATASATRGARRKRLSDSRVCFVSGLCAVRRRRDCVSCTVVAAIERGVWASSSLRLRYVCTMSNIESDDDVAVACRRRLRKSLRCCRTFACPGALRWYAATVTRGGLRLFSRSLLSDRCRSVDCSSSCLSGSVPMSD